MRVLGASLALVGLFTLIALFSPNGSVTQQWADKARQLAGWAAVPWSVVLLALGAAITRGKWAWRLAIAGRIAGAALLLLAAAALHQVLAGPVAVVGIGKHLALSPGADGYAGVLLGALTASWFGQRGAALVLQPLGAAGLVLLCGWKLATWRRIGQQVMSTLRHAGAAALWLLRLLFLAAGHVARVTAVIALHAGRWLHRSLVLAFLRARVWWAERDARAEARAAARAAKHAAVRAARLEAAALEAPPEQRLILAPPVEAPAITLPTATGGGMTVAPPIPKARPAPVPAPIQRSASVRWQLPSTGMLSAMTAQQVGEAEISEKGKLIERTLGAFGVPVQVKDARIGPRVTQFLLRPAEGVSVKKIKFYESDLQLVLSAQTLRIELPVPGRPVVGIEIPNSGISTVGMREILESPQFRESKGRLRIALGRDVDGNPRVGDLAKMPHLLIAGQTGSGKSYCVNAIIASLLFQATPEDLQLLMIDPKMVEMAQYEGIPHLKYPVVVDLAEAGKVLLWAVEEMERRYRVMAEAGYRNIEAYNKSVATAPFDPKTGPPPKPFPYLVLIIDELADLMMFAPDDVEPAICRLTAKARAVGIHLVVATQRPSVDVVTGLIKANMPSRIAFAVSSQIDSRVVLDMAGAETLLGRGDMLYLPYDQGKPMRVQGTSITDEEIASLVHFWKKQGSPQYVQKDEIDALMLRLETAEAEKNGDKQSPLIERAIALLHSSDHTSVSFLQRKLSIGYPRAARLMDDLEERGLVELDEGSGRSYRVVAEALTAISAPAEVGLT